MNTPLIDKIAAHLKSGGDFFQEDTQKAASQKKARLELRDQIKTGEIDAQLLKKALPDFEYNNEVELPVSKLIAALNKSNDK